MVSSNELLRILAREREPGTWWLTKDLSPEASQAFRGDSRTNLLVKGHLTRRALGQNDPRRAGNQKYEYMLT